MEKISELMDGELDSEEASIYLKRMKEDSTLREIWDVYHRVGDALRQESALSGRIARGVSARLQDEPTVLAPRVSRVPKRVMRYAMSAAASVAGVAVVAWIALGGGTMTPQQIAKNAAPGAQVAATAPDTTQAQATSLAAQDPAEVEDLLLAHQTVSSFPTMHGSLPYVRAVSTQPSK